MERSTPRQRLNSFLTQRLREELGQLWVRDRTRSAPDRRPGLAPQIEVLDDLLARLAAGRLPERNDLIVLLACYRKHDDFDPGWSRLA